MQRVILACALSGVLAIPAKALDGTRLPAIVPPVVGLPPGDFQNWHLARAAKELLEQSRRLRRAGEELLAQANPGGTVRKGVDPLIGTWKINFDNSTLTPPPKSLISTVSKEGDHLIAVADLVTADGQTFKTVFQLIYDGQPHPTTGFPNYDATAYTRIGNTINGVRFKQAKPVEVTQTVIVPGKTWTVTAEGIAANGRPYHFVLVYDRQ